MTELHIGITGNREVTSGDILLIKEAMKTICLDKNVKSVRFGGARGTDTIALNYSLMFKKEFSRDDLQLIVYLPDMLEKQPKSTWEITSQADEVVEMKNEIKREDGWASFRKRNEKIVSEPTNLLIAFWDGQIPSGTYDCMNKAKEKNVQIKTITIQGGD